MAARSDPEQPLKRLGGGRWQTRDERFTIEPQSGTWVVVDAEQTDELGLPLVRGPFPSLTAAKSAIASALERGPAISPLSATVAPAERAMDTADPTPIAPAPAQGSIPTKAPRRPGAPSSEPAEPRWLAELAPDERRRARRLLRALDAAGARDAEHIVRRDMDGRLPAVAAWAIARALAGLGDRPSVESVVHVLSDGRDRDLEVRWRLVDDEGRPITLEDRDLRDARDAATPNATKEDRG